MRRIITYAKMTTYDTYNLIICLIVFVLLTGLFSYLIIALIRFSLRTIRGGLDDKEIIKEFEKKKKKKKEPLFFRIINKGFPILMCVVLGVAVCFSLYSRFTANDKVGDIPTIKVVESGSMEYKNKANTYLFDLNLNDQVETFDAILLHELPKEEDLKLYDIVVYETNGYFVLHRIVGIEEPNANHPNERWFVLRGDANKHADEFPVTYSQMKSIYRGERVPFVGSFIFFMQSPAGMLCFLLIVITVFLTPFAERKLVNAKKARYALICASMPAEESENGADTANEIVQSDDYTSDCPVTVITVTTDPMTVITLTPKPMTVITKSSEPVTAITVGTDPITVVTENDKNKN